MTLSIKGMNLRIQFRLLCDYYMANCETTTRRTQQEDKVLHNRVYDNTGGRAKCST